ncbi:hypothetical protein BIY21_00410 [Vibrio ponticus]|uniref:Uncharacterized protein n=1 Tax=Vibrio ponticus TaxID=265668 RepID=A0ABX3FJC5_9VIBR|nr:hypothetical protein BIY21_00410 [Vibrio ponticus]
MRERSATSAELRNAALREKYEQMKGSALPTFFSLRCGNAQQQVPSYGTLRCEKNTNKRKGWRLPTLFSLRCGNAQQQVLSYKTLRCEKNKNK